MKTPIVKTIAVICLFIIAGIFLFVIHYQPPCTSINCAATEGVDFATETTCIVPDADGIAHDAEGEYIPGNNQLFILEQQVACYKGCQFTTQREYNLSVEGYLENNQELRVWQYNGCAQLCKETYEWEE